MERCNCKQVVLKSSPACGCHLDLDPWAEVVDRPQQNEISTVNYKGPRCDEESSTSAHI